MDGFVKGVTEFEQAVYNYLTDIKISQFTDSMNLFYVNSDVIPQGSDISDFIEKLIDLFKFRDYVYNGEFYIDTTEISTAKYGLTRGEYGEPVLIAYFIDPFEYIKFKIILSKLTDVRKIVSCEYCGSLFISQKSNRRFCDNLCRAQGSRKRKKELENKKRKKE